MKNNSLHIKKDGRIFQMLSGFTNVTKINRRYIMKYCSCFNTEKWVMEVKALTQKMLESRSHYEKKRNKYNTVDIFNSINDCLKDLNTYSKIVLLPNGATIVPHDYNYPELITPFKRVMLPLTETISG